MFFVVPVRKIQTEQKLPELTSGASLFNNNNRKLFDLKLSNTNVLGHPKKWDISSFQIFSETMTTTIW